MTHGMVMDGTTDGTMAYATIMGSEIIGDLTIGDQITTAHALGDQDIGVDTITDSTTDIIQEQVEIVMLQTATTMVTETLLDHQVHLEAAAQTQE